MAADMAELATEIDDLRDRYPNLKDDELFVLWFLTAYVFGSFRSHSPVSSRTSCSVTRTLQLRRSTRERRSPISSLQRMPASTAR